ncbi:SUN domain-containing ossification factor-like isoform X2 [Betta splendens]|uniref:SUN domain-containing ossification factor n=1 Tax=Betta splendens TaxID=158456 RepID=A0A6P7L021_BETSP|nr:SUN domain-containing ossification factor-like isoform X2 [Betta splendens]
MKMTRLLWRVVSLCLCVAAVCWRHCCYVGSVELHQEAQRPMSSQDISSEEESEEKTDNNKETWVLPTQSQLENKKLIEGNQHLDEQTTQEVDKNEQFSQVVQKEERALDVDLKADNEISEPEPESEPEQSTENLDHETIITEDQNSGSLLQSPDHVSGFAAELKDNPSISDIQDNTLNSVSDDASDVAALGVSNGDLLPIECDEKENNLSDNDGLPVVVENTSNAHTAGTKSHTDLPLGSPAGQHLEANTSHMLKEQDLSSPVTTDTDSSVSSKDPEDIPTFDEWKRKMMEVEKEKTLSTHTSNNGASNTVKKVQKNFNNYASVECGAKILGSNPEAKSTSAILQENMDLYMLNPCSNKIWFIIELCEPIQVKQLDIANFELFSSTPKDFLVSISDRYPTNKWLKLGTFHARDERTVQSFPLDEHLYAKYVKMFTKYIKVELVSHFGSEHYCPLSLIRVFGTSMVEEYEEIADPSERPDDQDDDLDYPPGYTPGDVKLSEDLIGSAKDVLLNMVNNIAVNVLGGSPGMKGNDSSHEVNTTEPSSQKETTQTVTSDADSVPHFEEVESLPDLNVPETAPSAEVPVPMAPDTSNGNQELHLVEEKAVIPLETEDEEHVNFTVTLLDKEDVQDEEKETWDHHEKQDSLNYCSLFPSCCCATSLQEYLYQQSSAMLSKKRMCQKTDKRPLLSPILTPTWHLPLSPTACPESQLHHSEAHQSPENQQASEVEPESGASPSETLQPPESTTESHKEFMSEPPVLEPSQTSNLPKYSVTDSSSAKPTNIVEPPQLSSEEAANELRPEKTQDVLAVEKYTEPPPSVSSSVYVKPVVTATLNDSSVASERKPNVDSQLEINTPDEILVKTDPSQLLPSDTSPDSEQPPAPPVVPESSSASTELPAPAPETITQPEHTGVAPEAKMEDLTEDISASSGGNGQLPRPSSDIYAEPPNDTEQSGNPVHGSSQKESVFMRLNNRIKALEMNMSLSGRYLEQLSQRYRKQMEEMQKAFNKTIIKLQNTSRVAEEQDQRQTESIQLLQGQLENLTQLVFNLSVRVSQLQNEVSDGQNYLLVSLALCLCLGLLLCANHCRISTVPPAVEPDPPTPKTYTHCCPEKHFCCDETSLKRSASYPLIHSESFQLATTEGPEVLHAADTQILCPTSRKRRRRKLKLVESVETLKPSLHTATELCNGDVVCNNGPITTKPTPLIKTLLQPSAFRDSPSEGSSEASSHSDDPSFCGITTACSRICDGLPPPKTRSEKRALRRRRPRPSCAVVDLLQAPRRDNGDLLPLSIQDIMNRKTEQSSGTFRVNVALPGPV